jgi:predicted nucleic acid-binding protein
VILLDTCVLSEIARPEPDPHVLCWFASVDERELFLSALTLGEIRRGASLLPRSKRRTRLEGWLDGLQRAFADRILPVDAETALVWGEISAAAERKGRKPPAVDGLIAAVARQHDATLATRNVRDFQALAVRILDPWKSTS